MKQFRFFLLLLLSFVGGEIIAQISVSTSFADNGVARWQVADYNDAIDIHILQGDSILLLANVSADSSVPQSDIAVIRLLPDGKIDSAFGVMGVSRFDFEGIDYSVSTKMLVLNNGKILVLGSGYSPINTAYQPVAIKRLWANGKVDSAFGVNGTYTMQLSTLQEFPRVLKADRNGNILIGGYGLDSTHAHASSPVLARIDESGKLDTAFGTNGKLHLHYPNDLMDATRHSTGGLLNDMLELNDGSWLVSGGYSNGNNLMGYIAKLKSNGAIDSSFFGNDYMAVDFTPFSSSSITKMAMKDSNTIWFGATSNSIQGKNFYVGNIDLVHQDFNVAQYDFGGREDVFSQVLISKEGNPIFVGKSIDSVHNFSWYQSDYIAIAYETLTTFPFHPTQAVFNFANGLQSGANAAALLSDGSLLCFGFNYTPESKTELAVAAFDLKLISGIQTVKETNDEVSIYPNPATDFIYLKMENNSEPYFVELIDSRGSSLSKYNYTESKERIDITSLPSGMYCLRIATERGKMLSKVIIKSD